MVEATTDKEPPLLGELKMGPSTCHVFGKCISVKALRTDVCFEDAWGLSMVLRRTGLGLRSLWRLCERGMAKEFVRLRCRYSPKVWAGVEGRSVRFAKLLPPGTQHNFIATRP